MSLFNHLRYKITLKYDGDLNWKVHRFQHKLYSEDTLQVTLKEGEGRKQFKLYRGDSAYVVTRE